MWSFFLFWIDVKYLVNYITPVSNSWFWLVRVVSSNTTNDVYIKVIIVISFIHFNSGFEKYIWKESPVSALFSRLDFSSFWSAKIIFICHYKLSKNSELSLLKVPGAVRSVFGTSLPYHFILTVDRYYYWIWNSDYFDTLCHCYCECTINISNLKSL